MEFLDEFESRPRFLFQSKQQHHHHHSPQPDDHHDPLHPSPSSFLSSLHKPTLFISLSFSLLFLTLALFHFNVDPIRSLLLWVSLSLLIGPFAPPSLTAGDIRVGIGPPLEEIPDVVPAETNEKFSRKSTKTLVRNPVEDTTVRFDVGLEKSDGSIVDPVENRRSNRSNRTSIEKRVVVEETEWSEEDEELLRKLMGKHPVGKPGRWEAIAEGFNGKRKVESVIARAKEMGDRKVSDQDDAYTKFLKNRKKPVDKRVIEEGENEINGESGGMNQKESEWSPAEDLALLNALKAFPKEVAMRWEKIAASVPGKTKAVCVKRVAELKKDFRSSKAGQS